jgi:calcineurin-like phosphoesterase family protein
MRFRDDIDPARTWVISDTHWGHKNIIGFCHRPDDFETLLLENIAQAVPDDPDVTLLHLGDLCYRGNAEFRALIAPHIQPKSGRKLLIAGNHDKQRYSFYKKCGFKMAHPFAIRWGSTVVSFSHYPWSTAPATPDGKGGDGGTMPANVLRVHGHIHNNGYTRSGYVPFLAQHVNLSVEQTKYRPVHLGTLLSAVLDGHYAADDGNPTGIDAEAVEKQSAHVSENE